MGRIFNKQGTKQLRGVLRNNMPDAEVILWSKLKNKQILGCKFRRQYGVDSYSIDFYSPQIKLAVELDGDSHYKEGAEEKDKIRQNLIERYGIVFLRFTNDDVRRNLNGVLLAIQDKIRELTATEENRPPATKKQSRPPC